MAEVLAAFLAGDQLCEIRTGQGLNAALEHAHANGQEPEFPDLIELNSKGRDPGIGRNADRDQGMIAEMLRKIAEEQGKREGDNLRNQKSDQEHRAVQSDGAAVGHRHIDNGVDAVNIKEEGQEEKEDAFVLSQFLRRMEKLFKDFAHLHLPFGYKITLLVAAQQRNGKNQPPDGIDNNGRRDRRFQRDPDALIIQHHQKTQNKRDAGRDIA